MAEIVGQQLQLDCAPQPSPRSAVYFIYEPMTQLREKRLYRLPHSAHQPFLRSGSLPCQHKQVGLPLQRLARLVSAIGLIGCQYASVCLRRKPDACFPIGYVSRRQCRRDDLALYVDQHVQLVAEEPPGAGLSEVCPLISEQSHHPMTDGLTDRDRFRVNRIYREAEAVTAPGRFDHLPDQIREAMKASDPLLVRAHAREGCGEVVADEPVSLFEGSDTQRRLHQGEGDNLSVSESRLGIRRRAPGGPPRVSFEVVVNEAIDFSHLIYNGSQGGRPPGAKFGQNTFTP